MSAAESSRALTPTNVLHNALTQQARALCDEIEKMPASDQQTRCAIAASDLLRVIYLRTPAAPPEGSDKPCPRCDGFGDRPVWVGLRYVRIACATCVGSGVIRAAAARSTGTDTPTEGDAHE